MPAHRGKYTQFAPPPTERAPPFLLVRDGGALVLLTPFRKRRRGLSPEEEALTRAVAARLAEDLPAGLCWIDPRDGNVTPASIGADQLRRRLVDDASFTLA